MTGNCTAFKTMLVQTITYQYICTIRNHQCWARAKKILKASTVSLRNTIENENSIQENADEIIRCVSATLS